MSYSAPAAYSVPPAGNTPSTTTTSAYVYSAPSTPTPAGNAPTTTAVYGYAGPTVASLTPAADVPYYVAAAAKPTTSTYVYFAPTANKPSPTPSPTPANNTPYVAPVANTYKPNLYSAATTVSSFAAASAALVALFL
ncbi:hypothetical protein HK100_008235 [Physocladia obscura]|uniref:Uncharacterized protein n=1 Tax=Physocladia obscura TaxID=109957 RepID=A0AAD5XAN5_9FUNG|nr:hypothetical protein HK100_008235 [Physocladia obscura]